MDMAKARVELRSKVTILVLLALMVVLAIRPVGTVEKAAASDLGSTIGDDVNYAASLGIDQYVVVIDRTTRQVIASTSNAGTLLASESLVKLYIAIWWLHQTGGNASAVSCGDIGYMIRSSDDATASACWRNNIMGDVSQWYDLHSSFNNPGQPGYWGATRVSASDVAWLLYHAGNDPIVSTWLTQQMMAATDWFSDGINQNYGFNAIPGAASKQGWGHDAYWMSRNVMIHSAGYVNNVAAVVLQAGGWANNESVMYGPITRTAWGIANNTNATGGAVGAKYSSIGGIAGYYGLPLGREVGVPGGVYQDFQGGKIYWSSSTGAHTVRAAVLSDYATQNWQLGALGWPTSDEITVNGGVYQNFQGGQIHWSPASGAHATRGAVAAEWAAQGWQKGPLGWPTSDTTFDLTGGGSWESFMGGVIVASGGHVGVVPEALVTYWLSNRNMLGVPTTDVTCAADGPCSQVFNSTTITRDVNGHFTASPAGASLASAASAPSTGTSSVSGEHVPQISPGGVGSADSPSASASSSLALAQSPSSP